MLLVRMAITQQAPDPSQLAHSFQIHHEFLVSPDQFPQVPANQVNPVKVARKAVIDSFGISNHPVDNEISDLI